MKKLPLLRLQFCNPVLLLALVLCSAGLLLSATTLPASAAPWSVVPSPNTSSTQTNSLDSVDCTSATDCWSVGSYDKAGVQRTLIQRWNGTSWTIVPSPNSGAAENNVLNSVACTSPAECWAVGSYTNSDITGGVDRTLILRWNGTFWSIRRVA